MPFLVLLLTAAVAWLLVFVVAGALHRYGSAAPPTARLARAAGQAAARKRRLRNMFAGRFDPAAATGFALSLALGLVIVGGVILAVLAYLIRSNAPLGRIDQGVAQWGDESKTALSTHGLNAVTTLGETWFVVVAGLVLAAGATLKSRTRWAAPFLLCVVLGNNILTSTVKELADRVRPDLNPLAATLGPSFPSGHSSTSAAFYAAAALVLGRHRGATVRSVLAASAAALAIAVACSRVLLDVHWLSDVVAGLMLGWAWFALCAIAFGGRLLRFGSSAKQMADSTTDAAHDRI